MNQDSNNQNDADMLPEYDFTGGARGKYVDRFPEGCNVVVLDADVARVFTDSESVNWALRALAGIIEHRLKKFNGSSSSSREHVEQVVGRERAGACFLR
ncbi:MAG: hypothetical protein ABR607_16610 [Pyrinomonadaceae bacterium]